MFIGIAGPICSGKRTIANFLITNHEFTRLRLRHIANKCSSTDNLDALATSTPSTPPVVDDGIHNLSNGVQNIQVNRNGGEIWFESMEEMVDYVTKRWRQNFVTVDIWTVEDLEIIAKRPFFLLVSVDAPITIRWKRFNERLVPDRYVFNGRCIKLGKCHLH